MSGDSSPSSPIDWTVLIRFVLTRKQKLDLIKEKEKKMDEGEEEFKLKTDM